MGRPATCRARLRRQHPGPLRRVRRSRAGRTWLRVCGSGEVRPSEQARLDDHDDAQQEHAGASTRPGARPSRNICLGTVNIDPRWCLPRHRQPAAPLRIPTTTRGPRRPGVQTGIRHGDVLGRHPRRRPEREEVLTVELPGRPEEEQDRERRPPDRVLRSVPLGRGRRPPLSHCGSTPRSPGTGGRGVTPSSRLAPAMGSRGSR